MGTSMEEMGAFGYRFRAELRSSGRQLLVTALVLGMVGGLALGALAGARPQAPQPKGAGRYLEISGGWDASASGCVTGIVIPR